MFGKLVDNIQNLNTKAKIKVIKTFKNKLHRAKNTTEEFREIEVLL